MALVVDVDSHWTFPWEFDLERGPLKEFADKLGGRARLMATFLADDLIRSLPVDERPSPDVLFPEHVRSDGVRTNIPIHWERGRDYAKADERVEWMDKVGIDYAIVNSGGFPAAFPLLEDVKDRQRYCTAANEVLADALKDRRDRLGMVTYVDLNDLDWAIGELRRRRDAGSRVLSIRAEPVGGKSLGHPHFDRLWSALVDMGMIVSLHIGLAPSLFGDWGRLGLDTATPEGRAAFFRMSNSQRYQSAELFLSALLYGGVFERHPKLTVLIAELYAFWMPMFVRRHAGLTHKAGSTLLGDWPYPLSADQYLRRQVRVSPLIGLGDFDALQTLQAIPDMTVFSSDYPHTEGNADPIELYGEGLNRIPAELRERFMGGSMQERFEVMGDPLPMVA